MSFKRHGIAHLSASSLQAFRIQPALWCLRYLKNLKDDENPAMVRGNAVEAGLKHWLYGQPDPLVAALRQYELKYQGEVTEAIHAERANIAPMLDQAIASYGEPKMPTATQLRTEVWLDGIDVPVIGYLDFLFEDGIEDLKTTRAIPSEIKPEHRRQVAIYIHSRGKNEAGRVRYVSTKKSAVYPVEDVDGAIKEIHADALCLKRFLAKFWSADEALSVLPADLDHYLWTDKTRTAFLTQRAA